MSAVDGRADDALDDALALLALARGIGDEPLLLSQLVRMAFGTLAARSVERTLGLGEPSAEKLLEVRYALLAEADVPKLLPALRGERASMSRMADDVESGKLKARELLAWVTDRDPGEAGAGPAAVGVGAILPEAHAKYLKLMNRAVAAAELPLGPDRAAEFAAIDRDACADDSWEGKGARHVFLNVMHCDASETRARALLRATSLACALERERRKSGAFPAKLIDLPADPWTDERMLTKRLPDGVAVYTTGPDGKDDSFLLPDHTFTNGDDVGVRLFDPKHRRRPAPKEGE